jgi:hypothetical protein
MYEKHNDELLPRPLFARRVLLHAAVASLVIAGALLFGMVGYHCLGALGWTDSFLNASMILGGMGPVNPLQTTAAKLFAGTYALFAGLVFIGIAGLVLAPFLHRLMHRFHLEDD